MTHPTIGFIGLGAMGEPMAARLLAAGYPLVSCANRSREAFDRLAEAGLVEVEGPSQVGREAELLISIVFDEPQNDQVLRGPNGALAAMNPGGVVLVMSTVSPRYCQELAAEAAKRQLAVLDCPVSGLTAGAREGTLTLMLGGDPAAVEPYRAAVEVLGRLCPCGDVGMGQVMKVANNAMAVGTWALLMEIREAVGACGMELDHFLSILNQSSGRSFVSEHFPMPRKRVGLPVMAHKDLGICRDLAQEQGVAVPILEEVLAEKGTA